MESILDSTSKLVNLKNRFGLRVRETNTVSVYLAQQKLSRHLNSQLQSKMEIDWERGMLVDKIVDRCEDLDTINGVYELLKHRELQEFIDLASGKIRPFFKQVYQFCA